MFINQPRIVADILAGTDGAWCVVGIGLVEDRGCMGNYDHMNDISPFYLLSLVLGKLDVRIKCLPKKSLSSPHRLIRDDTFA
ncbi:hypothetical protein DPMN_022338 [Dreissena polymorpha]|uniref:Uncharacterized protein n=1 Tax=Dreissena polymorpha TaxID=45954 RepID=A0A9D4NP81_DREPO|nr:hypothetical protein DPMN_022338 [Dreissena polymorpha]